MGNLPAARTVTMDDSSPVASALLNELQDAFVTGIRGLYTGRPIVMPFYSTGLTPPAPGLLTTFSSALVATGSASFTGWYVLDIEAGESVVGVVVDVEGAGVALTVVAYLGTPAQLVTGASACTQLLNTTTYTPPSAVWTHTVMGAAAPYNFVAATPLDTQQVVLAIGGPAGHAGIALGGVRAIKTRTA